MRAIINQEPFVDSSKHWSERALWPAKWICHPDHQHDMPFVLAYRCSFNLNETRTLRIHVSADERYELFCDGERIGRGPERGDISHWFFQTYDLELSAGEHIFVARCWSLGHTAPAPYAQIYLRPGFLLAAEGVDKSLVNTGESNWECKQLGGYSFLQPGIMWGTGAKVSIDGASFPWGYERGAGDGWIAAIATDNAISASCANEHYPVWLLAPSTLPAMIENTLHAGSAVYIDQPETDDTESIRIDLKNNIQDELGNWNTLVMQSSSLQIPSNTTRRVIIDLGNYYCAFPQITLSKGTGASVRMHWSEGLFIGTKFVDYLGCDKPVKGNRNEIDGKCFIGTGDVFISDGGDQRTYDTLWWESGRYIEVLVKTLDEPLIINDLCISETHYPYKFDFEFKCDDSRFESVTPIAVRVLEMCSHETYMDCPYYEQLMYVGDTRLEVLATYAITSDDRLPRKALVTFDRSRLLSGITQSRYPCRVRQIIPPFSVWWVSMVHDYSMWRSDSAFVASLMPGVRAVLDCYWNYVNADGLVQAPNGWNFMDWVPNWVAGVPPDGDLGVNALINWQFVYALQQASELEAELGEPELAARHARRADELAKACEKAFWDSDGGLFADDLSKTHFSEHVQCIALLSGKLSADKAAQCAKALFERDDLARTTIYFTHYLFETYKQLGRVDKLMERMEMWFDLESQGFKTTPEEPEPSRSDCHAWGAHPLYHYFASILGIRPAAPGFTRVNITPSLVHLKQASGILPHPNGEIKVSLQNDNGKLTGEIELPDGVTGSFTTNTGVITLKPGKQNITG